MITKIPSSFLSKTTTPFLTRGVGAHVVFQTRRTLQSSIPRAAAMAAPHPAARHHHPEWSGSLSHATPEADFTALHVSANSATMESEWSQELSFAAPESDFTATATRDDAMTNYNTRHNNNNANNLHLHVSANAATMESEWAHEILLKNARQDVAALQAALETPAQNVDDDDDKAMILDRMLHQWTLSSPESAIGYTHVAETMNEVTRTEFGSVLHAKGLSMTEPSLPSEASSRQSNASPLNAADGDRMMQQLQVTCPESAVGFVHVAEFLTKAEQEQFKELFQGQEMPSVLPSQEATNQNLAAMDLMMQQQLLSCPESATGFVHVAETMTSEERHDFITALKKQQQSQSQPPLPTTYQQALQDPYHRAIVITTAEPPFRVVHVNDVWEGLCGFTQQEAHHQPIGKLLQGPETQAAATRQLVQQVLEQPNQHQTVQLINYTKNGRKFYNHLQLGALLRADATNNNNNNNNNNQSQDHTTNAAATTTSKVEYLIGVLTEVGTPDQQQHEEKGQKMAA